MSSTGDGLQGMKKDSAKIKPELVTEANYWPARAAKFVAIGRYSRAVEICKEYLDAQPFLLSGRIIYARALYYAGQMESAEEEFYRVLEIDPDHAMPREGRHRRFEPELEEAGL